MYHEEGNPSMQCNKLIGETIKDGGWVKRMLVKTIPKYVCAVFL